MTSTEPPAWLRDPALDGLWQRIRLRLERNGLTASGSVRLAGLDRATRHAIGGLLGRTLTTAAVTLDLAELDESCRTRAGMSGLVAAIEALTGSPMTDRRAVHELRVRDRELPYSNARSWIETHGWQPPWLETWLTDIRAAGLLTRAGHPPRAITDALNVLAHLASDESIARTDLAASVVGNAHALDDGTSLSQLVLRALSVQHGFAPAVTNTQRRRLWARAGVRPDAVSTTVLAFNLRPRGSEPVAQRLRSAAESGDPTHLSAWDVARCDLAGAALGPVLVCENPRVLEAIAEASSDACVVCGFGQPTNLVLDVLRRVGPDSAGLRYHGDFDWPGIHIANRMMRAAGVEPWLMGVEDYEAGAAVDGPGLSEDPVRAVWDDRLMTAMLKVGVAVHEEAVLGSLLAAVASW